MSENLRKTYAVAHNAAISQAKREYDHSRKRRSQRKGNDDEEEEEESDQHDDEGTDSEESDMSQQPSGGTGELSCRVLHLVLSCRLTQRDGEHFTERIDENMRRSERTTSSAGTKTMIPIPSSRISGVGRLKKYIL